MSTNRRSSGWRLWMGMVAVALPLGEATGAGPDRSNTSKTSGRQSVGERRLVESGLFAQRNAPVGADGVFTASDLEKKMRARVVPYDRPGDKGLGTEARPPAPNAEGYQPAPYNNARRPTTRPARPYGFSFQPRRHYSQLRHPRRGRRYVYPYAGRYSSTYRHSRSIYIDPYGKVYDRSYELDDAYRSGYEAGIYYVDLSVRYASLNRQHAESVSEGTALFRNGLYREAADAFELAAKVNQGDPAARIHSGHAHFALGKYDRAISRIRRAFELQPRIVYLNYDIRGDYGNVDEFAAQLAALEEVAKTDAPKRADRLALLGYMYRYSGQRDKADATLADAVKLAPRDPLIEILVTGDSNPPAARAGAK